MKLEDLHNSKIIHRVVASIGIIIVILLILLIGINIGERKAGFAREFGNNFQKNFMGPNNGMIETGFNRMMPGGHGAIGEILSIKLPQIIISGPDNLEKTVIVTASTTIRKSQDNIASSDLKTGNFVVIIGEPNQNGQIEAKLIRIMIEPQ